MTCECKVCGAKYETCYTCEKSRSWRLHTDTLDHYYIFVVLMSYEVNHDAKAAYDALVEHGVNFDEISGYNPTVQKLLTEIKSAQNTKTKAQKGAD